MVRRVAFPFFTLNDSTVHASPWSLSLNGGPRNIVGDYLSDWDSSSAISIHRELSADFSLASLDLEIEKDQLHFLVNVQIGTGQGRLPRKVIQQLVEKITPERCTVNFDIEIPGAALSRVLDIYTDVTLASPIVGASILSPKHTGDRLWQDRIKVRIEGEEPRFPIEVCDLRVLLGNAAGNSAPWLLQWSPRDWSQDFHGAVRLLLNANAKEVISRIESEDTVTLQTLMADVMGQVCERLLMDTNADEVFVSPEPGSLGAQAVTWLAKCWPGQDLGFIRSILENRPGTFRAAFLELSELPED